MSYVPGSVAVSSYFPDKYHGVVFGICSSGVGFGMLSAPVIVDLLTEQYSWRGAMIIQAGLNFHLVACGAILYPLPGANKESNYHEIGLLKNVHFSNFLLHIGLFAVGMSVINVHFAFAVQKSAHLSTREAALAVSVIGLTGTAGRLIHGLLAKAPKVNAMAQYSGSFFLFGVATLLLPHPRSYLMVLLLAACIGFLQGPYGGVVTVLMIYMVGVESATAGFGYLHLAVGVGLVAGAPIAGYLYDLSHGSYDASMYFGGGAIILSVLIMVRVLLRWNTIIVDARIDEGRAHGTGKFVYDCQNLYETSSSFG